MLIIPAIDIKDGNCVRLLQGDPGRQTVYSRDPVEMAKRFQDAGAKLIHVVDLDGAFDGVPVNREIVTAIAKSVSIPIEIGGGIRSLETVRMYADNGIHRIIVGTIILEQSFLPLIERFRDVLVAGIDSKNSMVATHGWKKVSGIKALDMIRDIIGLGILNVIYTDIATDGMLSGPNVGAIKEILTEIKQINLIASGGISSMDDLEKFSLFEQSGLTGCIIGKAIYDGRIDLREAVSRFG